MYKMILCFFLFVPLLSSQASFEYASARIIDDHTNMQKSKIVVVYGNDDSEVIALKKYPPLTTQALGYTIETDQQNTTQIENQKVINTFLESMSKKGYEIQETESTSNVGISLFILFKKRIKAGDNSNLGVQRKGKRVAPKDLGAAEENIRAIIQDLDINLEGKNISLKVCINSAGRVTYAEVLNETTLSMSAALMKKLLREIYGLEFITSSKVEDCDTYLID